MRTFFHILASAATLLIAATSCDLSFEADYTFSYEIAYELQTQEQVDAFETYFDEFIKAHNNRTFHGEYSAALEKGVEYFINDSKDLDETFIKQHLATDQDVIRLLFVVSSNKIHTIAAYQTWIGEDPAPNDA